MSLKKIVFIITDLDNGGAEKMLYKLIKYSDRNKYDIHVIYLTGKGVTRKDFEELNIKITFLGLKRKIPTIKAIKKTLEVCKEADIIQTWMYHADLWGYIIGKVFLNKKVVFGIRHSNLEKNYNKKTTLLINKVNAHLSRKVDKIVSCSEKGKENHIKCGYKEDKFLVIPNGFELDDFDKNKLIDVGFKDRYGIKNDEKVIVSVGRWNKIKDYHNLIKAIGVLNKQGFKFKCLLVGTGIDKSNEQLMEWIREETVEEKVILLGRSTEVHKILSNSDLYVLHSAGEGFPNTLGEAMSCGVPCVATDVGDCRLMLGGLGTVVERKNFNALAKAMGETLNLSSDESIKEGDMLRKRIEENYDIKKIVQRFYDLYSSLLVEK